MALREGERLTIDPKAEAAANSPLVLAGFDARSHGLNLLELEIEPPEQKQPAQGVQPSQTLGEDFWLPRDSRAKLRLIEPQDPAATNLCAAPGGEGGLVAGWATSGAPAVVGAVPSAASKVGDWTIYVGYSAGAQYGYYGPMTVPALARIDVGMWVLNAGSALGEKITIAIHTGSAIIASPQITLTDEWQWVTFSTPMVTGTTTYIYISSVNASGTVGVDGVTVVAGGPSDGSAVSNGFDGDAPGCAWTGTPHASTSTRPAPGNARYNAIIGDLEAKVLKLTREQGTLRRRTPQGITITYDVIDAKLRIPIDRASGAYNRAEPEIRFRLKPFWRGTPVQLADHVGAGVPVLSFTETAIPGSIPALGKLMIDNDSSFDQFTAIWGSRSWSYDAAATAAAHHWASNLTSLGGSTNVADAASGLGTVKQSPLLAPEWLAVLSTDLTAGGAMTHRGPYGVWARVRRTGAAGDISLRLEWGQGDYRTIAREEPVVLPDTLDPSYLLVYLGDINIDPVLQGSQRWQGRVTAKSEVAGADRILIDWLLLCPAERGGIASATQSQDVPTSFTARDEFDQAGGALAGKTLPIGGTWTLHLGTDFTVDATAHNLTRTSVSDAAIAITTPTGTAALTAFLAQADMKASRYVSNAAPLLMLVGRYVDVNNYMAAVIAPSKNRDDLYLWVFINIAGVTTNLIVLRERHKLKKRKGRKKHKKGTIKVNKTYTLRLQIDTTGRWMVWMAPQGDQLGDPLVGGRRAELASGGALAAGRVGLADANTTPTAVTRTYENFYVAPLVADAAAFATRSLEVRHDGVIRQDSAAALWTPVTDYQGDAMIVPPTAPEGRPVEYVIKLTRNDPELLAPDTGTLDALSARLTVIPRGIDTPQ